MSALTRFSLKNTVAVFILFLLVLASGFYGTKQIKLATFPDISYPALFVQVTDPGQTAEDMEKNVAIPIENALKSQKGYQDLTSTSSENSATLSITYPFGQNMDDAQKKVDDAISKAGLPDTAKYQTKRLSTGAMPIYTAAFSATDGDKLQSFLDNNLIPKMEKVQGVSSVQVFGEKTVDLKIEVDKDKLQNEGITISDIKNAIQGKEYALPLGNVTQDGNSIPVRLIGNLSHIQDLENMTLTVKKQGIPQVPMGSQPSSGAAIGKTFKLSDLATVTQVTKQEQITRFNGEQAMVVQVTKDQDANTVQVSNDIKSLVSANQKDGGYNLHVVMDQGAEVQKSVTSLVREGLLGALFTIIVILLFLRNFRATLISIISLPISIFATIALLNQMGYSLNIMTLGGMAVAVGRIVDDSIVVIENIYRWRQEKGEENNGKELAYYATREVLGAVGSSTLATVVVFLPLGFVSGMIGEFFRPFAYAVVFSILASFIVAIMVIPALGATFFKNIKPKTKESWMARQFEKVIRFSLRRRIWVIVLSLLLLAGSLSLIPKLGVSFLPSGGSPGFTVNITLPASTDITKTDAVAKKVESYLKGLKGIDYSQVQIGVGGMGGRMGASGKSNPNQAQITVQMKNGTNMENLIPEVNKQITQMVTADIPAGTVNTKESQGQGPPSGNNITIDLYADNLDTLSTAASQVEELLKKNQDLKDVSNNMKDKRPKWVVTLNQNGVDAGLSAMQLMSAASEFLGPVSIGTYDLDGKTWNLSAEYTTKVTTLDDLKAIKVTTSKGAKTLGDLADVSQQDAPVSISHLDGKTYAEVSATIKGKDTATISKKVTNDLAALKLPNGVTTSTGGGMKMIKEGMSSLIYAMLAAILLVFLILSVTFGGIMTPLIILTSLIFVPIGAITGLMATGLTLSMSAMIGLLMLIGIVVTNAVVLMDRVEKNRKEGMDITEALVEASKVRLRPILMTAFATIFALLPLALSNDSAALISKGLAVTVIGGLTTSTFLTLIVIPAIYSLVGKKRKFEKAVL